MASRSQQCRTPVKADRRDHFATLHVKSPSQASPEVKAKLLELRKAASRTNRDAIKPIQLNTPRRGTAVREIASDSDEQGGSTSDSASEAVTPLDEVAFTVNSDKQDTFRVQDVAYGKATLDGLITEAKTSGRLNIASRDLDAIPAEVFMQLLPTGSPLLPVASNPLCTGPAVANLDFSTVANRRHVSGPKWWDTVDLVYLNLSYNSFRVLENALGGFEALRDLDLRANSLSELPPSLECLVNLTTLNLSRNQFTRIPEQCKGMTNLKQLALSHNGLTGDLPLNSVVNLPNLLDLDLSHNEITTIVVRTACDDASPADRLRSLQRMNLSYNCISDVVCIAKTLRGRATRLEGGLTPSDVAIVPPQLDDALVIVDVSHNPLKQAGPPQPGLASHTDSSSHKTQIAPASSHADLLARLVQLTGRLEHRLREGEVKQPSVASLTTLGAAIETFLGEDKVTECQDQPSTPIQMPSAPLPQTGTPRRNRQLSYAWEAL